MKMKSSAFVQKAIDIAKNYKTLYVMGAFGAPLNTANKARYTGPNANSYNRQPTRTALINAASSDTYAFDCVGLIKGILWGWSGNLSDVYGGATYASNGVPDINAGGMIGVCSDVCKTFDQNKMVPGEVCWKEGHIGIYIGDGLAVECTPAWSDKVQITACNCDRTGYNRRNWTKHGKLPYVDYSKETVPEPKPEPAPEPEPEPEPAPEPEKPPIQYPTIFNDVPAGKYYTKAVQWAYENGITKGTDELHFSPDKPCTRAEVVTFLYRLYKLMEGK